MPPIRKATTAVSSGTAMPPARWPSHIFPANVIPGSSSLAGGSGTSPGSGGRVGARPSSPVLIRQPPVGRSRGLLLAPAAEHLEPDLLLAHVGRVLAHDLALVHDEDAIRQRHDLVQLERDQQDRAALVALLDEPGVQVL